MTAHNEAYADADICTVYRGKDVLLTIRNVLYAGRAVLSARYAELGDDRSAEADARHTTTDV